MSDQPAASEQPSGAAPPSRRPGRRSVRTSDNARRIADGLGRGLPLRQVCAACNVAVSSVCAWRIADAAFEQQIQAAIAAGTESRLRVIELASLNDWRAAAWLLERTVSDTFGKQRTEQQQIHINGDKVVIFLPAKGENEQAKQIREDN